LDNDFGPNEVFASMANNCFEYTDLEYTYKMCAFDFCVQKPLHGGSETRLGSWEKWSVPHTQMSYERGVQCWNGPSRSTKVDLRCGAENKLVAASEPSKCEYLFVFETPAVCEPLAPLQHDEL
jgi:protein kinase C substrate 80K-H